MIPGDLWYRDIYLCLGSGAAENGDFSAACHLQWIRHNRVSYVIFCDPYFFSLIIRVSLFLFLLLLLLLVLIWFFFYRRYRRCYFFHSFSFFFFKLNIERILG